MSTVAQRHSEVSSLQGPTLETEGGAPLRLTNIVWNAAIALAWLALYRPVIAWLEMIYSRDDFRLNLILLIGIVLLAASRIPRGGRLSALATAPTVRVVPLVLVGTTSVAYLLTERFLDINILSGTLFGLGSYALLGLWLDPHRWRAGIPVALLVIGTLPFGAHMDTFIGYPARIATARWVASILGGAGIAAFSAETVLHLESGVAHVDLPCSGVRSLWTGGLLYLAATWIEGRRIGVRWLLVAAVLSGLLMLANMGRVLALVVAGEVFAMPIFAEMLHVPLGVLGFAGACGAGVWLLRRLVPAVGETSADETGETGNTGDSAYITSKPGRSNLIVSLGGDLRPALLAVIVLGAITLQSRLEAALAASVDLTWPVGLAVSPAPLTMDELEWLTRDGAEAAQRVRFEWLDVSGSLIVITSSTWRGQHLPERCLEVRGLPIDDNSMRLIAPDFPARRVALGGGTATAAYWFQSPTRVTDDYAERMWADVGPDRERWALVTVLFDGNVDVESPDARSLLEALRGAVTTHLGAEDRLLEDSPHTENTPADGRTFHGGS